MSTHATIAVRAADGSRWVGVYNHSDGGTLKPRIEAAIKVLGADAVRKLIADTPQGFSFFDPTNSTPSIVTGEPLHRAFDPGDPDTTEHGFGSRHSPNWEYTYIIELDGSVTDLAPMPS